MNLDLELLTTVADCDNAIEITQAEKTLLERRLRNLGEALEDRTVRTTHVEESIVSKKAIIAGFQSALTVITDEKEKRNLELKIDREEYKLKSLENRSANYSVVNVLEDQIDHQQLASQIQVLTDAIAQIETRKADLAA
ncbi:conserved hypothetical protein [Tenacibaculum sp. 190524A02b]|uniref:Uncharacterized protein n=1 Tax=Tenacibaculum vairaonense TaxID=3137860 RepID=A0ABP1F5D5_9FLAO